MRLRKILPVLFCCACCAALLSSLSVPASALGSMDYILDTDGTTHIPIPITHNISGFWDYFGSDAGFLREPADLFVAPDDTLYIADTGNDRVVHLDAEGNYVRSYTDDGRLSGPRGVYADADGHLYISDTGNRRIVHLSPEGAFIEEFTRPESELLEENLSFEVGRVGLSPQGYLYTIRGQYFMAIDAENQFKGYVGTNRVGFDFQKLLIRLFASPQQKAKLLKERPASYNSFAIGPDGLVYAVTDESAGSGQIQRINITGKNIYPVKSYGERIRNVSTGALNNPRFTDIAVSREGNVYVLEQHSCQIFVYDSEGGLLAVFGGEGITKGRLAVPSALDVNAKGDVFVLDQQTGYLHRFSRTAFFRQIVAAVSSYGNGDYDQSLRDWQRVLDIDSNYTVANQGIARSLVKFDRHKEAMTYFETAGDQAGYGNAFTVYRYGVFRRHFGLIVALAALLAAGLILLCLRLKRKSDNLLTAYFARAGTGGMHPAGKALLMIFHPLDCLDILKRDHRLSAVWAAPVFTGITFVVNYVCIFFSHYSMGGKMPIDANILLEAALVAVPLLSWTAAAYAMSAIMSGESRFTELLTASSYTLTPYIILTPVITLLSNIMGHTELAIYNSLRMVLLLWVLILLFTTFKRLNDYTFFRAAGITALSLFAAVVMWAVILLLFSLTVQLWSLLQGVLEEFDLKYLR